MKPQPLLRALLPLLVVSLVPAAAEEIDPKIAAGVSDRAISMAVAWRFTAANEVLTAELKYKDTQSYQTASALTAALDGIGKDPKEIQRGLEGLKTQALKKTADPVAEFYRGEVLKALDKTADATAAWQSAEKRAAAMVTANPADARAQYYLGAASNRLKKAAAARAALTKALEGGFDPAMTHFQIGLSWVLESKWSQALESFNAVEKADPRFAHLYYYRGLTQDKLGRKDRLIIDLDQFVKLAPTAPEAKTARAILGSVK
ncbi:MAG: hypothetical protein MUC56_05710 [Thermoanaerobaculales bacterium]|jgi:tetratricopeptide (TPR) repeat protein|nr:hypothetical protein [Thermoanaerobaculales bacterium]